MFASTQVLVERSKRTKLLNEHKQVAGIGTAGQEIEPKPCLDSPIETAPQGDHREMSGP